MPRLLLHRLGNPPAADRRGRTHGPAGRIHHPRLPGRETRPLAGRGRGRHDRLVVTRRARAGLDADARRILRRARIAARKTAEPHLAAGTGTRLLGGGCGVRRPYGAARDDAAHRCGDRPPAQFVRTGQRHPGGRRRGHRRSAERRQIDAAQPTSERGAGHGLGDRRNHARRDRGVRQHRRRAFPVPRHGRHPPDRRPARTNGHPAHDVEHRTGADRHSYGRRLDAHGSGSRPGFSAPSRAETPDRRQQDRQGSGRMAASRRRCRHFGQTRRGYRRPVRRPAGVRRHRSALPRRPGRLEQPPLRSAFGGPRSTRPSPRRSRPRPSDRSFERRNPPGHHPPQRHHGPRCHRPRRNPAKHLLEILHRQMICYKQL